ncbi:MAG TPA: SusC/RagA family TonB-linked outer membrane protein [Flavisolibacter sp.]|nr:SusC/RagA family TonB-linked outer membrane protein [Flavisolibacter sp.]
MKARLCLLLGLLAGALFCQAQTRTVTGTVLDFNGLPLANSTVRVIGGPATITDSTGRFTINVPATASNIEISAVGFTAQTIPIPADGVIEVRLQQAAAGTLQEVVVTGYGTRRRTEFTGATSRVSAQQIQQVPMASFDQILQGRAAGLYVASGSGQPGSSARVNIRGVGTLGGGSDPLYVVDGVPVEVGVFRTLNPNDFESVDVLKDASGTSLYGSRGANGVIVITTRRGRSGTPQFQYRGQAGLSRPPESTIDMMNTDQRLQFEERILGPSGILSASGGLTGFPGWDYSPNNPRYQNLSAAERAIEAARLDSVRQINTNWQDVFFRNGTFTSHELNASGGTANTSFYTSLSYFHQEGVVLRSSLDRYTFRANVDFRTDRLTVGVRSGAGWSRQSGIESEAGIALANPIAAAFLTLPYERLYRPNGSINTGAGRIGPNAFERLQSTTSLNNQFKGNLSVTAQFDIWNGLSFRSTNGLDYRNNNTSRFIDPRSFAGQSLTANGGQGSYAEGNSEFLNLITTSGLVFSRTVRDRHRINAQALIEFIANRQRNFSGTGFGIIAALPNTPAAITPGSATNNFIPLVSGARTRNALFSQILSGDYTFDRKYTLSASVRNDMPSQVPEENRNNIFWSVGASWNVMEEAFMNRQKIFQELRVRASHGTAANAQGFTSDFGYLVSYGAGGYAGVPGIVPTSPGNPLYELEYQVISNLGIELSTWQRRARAVFEIYNKSSRRLFASQPLSRTTGFNALNTNAGTVRNRGFEMTLSADVVSQEKFVVTLGFNAAYTQNRIISLGALNEFVSGTSIVRVGYPIGTHFVVGLLGIDPQTGNPIYEDSTGKPTSVYSASNNRAEYGTFLPKWQGGFSTDVTWRNFDLRLLFSFAQDVQRFNNERFFYEGGNNLFQYNQRVEMLNSWTQPGQVTEYQRIGAGNSRQFTSRDINDASFFRMRNVNLGYTFNFNNNKPIRGFRLFAQAQNLFTWTKWEGFDPEESNNIATYEFPNPKTYTVGLDINF